RHPPRHRRTQGPARPRTQARAALPVRRRLHPSPPRAGKPGRSRPDAERLTMAAQLNDDSLGKPYTAAGITVLYDRGRCRHYAECVHGLPKVFDVGRRPWIRADLADAESVAEIVRRCPTGALHYRLATGQEQPTTPAP